ncbi:GDT1-like protein 3 isoform X6 [Brassica napus]|nr:GDT1-like protein 3 isoform X6 [Brassica napus]
MSASSSFPPSLRRNLGLTRNRKDLIKSLAVVECLGALGLNLESTWPGVFDAMFSSFSMILVTEIGDETFIIAALMAMRHPKATILYGALSALFVMTDVDESVF